ncbi:MAG TPA: RluA family pseudouridine synthase [Pirellulaceae bacterium]|nr:RluA family pseudouridine synthase [Pirellulaceae bacterium]
MSSRNFHLAAEHDGLTLAAALKRLLADQSWSQVRKVIASRRVQVNGNLCLDEERHVGSGDVVKLLDHALAPPVNATDVRLVYVDEHLVVVQKPAGVTTLRHREETDLPQRRKQLQPTLDELVQHQLAHHLGIALHDTSPQRKRGARLPEPRRSRKPAPDKRLRIRPVHRLDRDTSGLMVFARTPEAEQKLIRMFAKHEVQRAYVAVVHGRVEAQTIDTWFVRDRGDGLRGSTPLGEPAEGAQRAITHLRPMEQLTNYTIIECRLETGRTHQIRIHLSEIGHPICGEKLYTHLPGQPPQDDTSGAPRQALHSAELAFIHPTTGQPLRFRMPLPHELKDWLLRLRQKGANP